MELALCGHFVLDGVHDVVLEAVGASVSVGEDVQSYQLADSSGLEAFDVEVGIAVCDEVLDNLLSTRSAFLSKSQDVEGLIGGRREHTRGSSSSNVMTPVFPSSNSLQKAAFIATDALQMKDLWMLNSLLSLPTISFTNSVLTSLLYVSNNTLKGVRSKDLLPFRFFIFWFLGGFVSCFVGFFLTLRRFRSVYEGIPRCRLAFSRMLIEPK